MELTNQLAKSIHSERTVVSSTAVGSSVLGTLFWLTISVGLLVSAAFGMAGILGCAMKVITGAMQ